MRKIIISTAVIFLACAASVYATPGITMHSTTRYESHSMATGDNSAQQVLSVALPVGSRASVVGTAGLEYDFQDEESANTILGLAYIHSFNKKSYAIASYNNLRTHGSAQDGLPSDTLDALFFMHSYAMVKRGAYSAYLRSSLTTDTAFDTGRVWGEQVYMTLPLKKKYTASIGMQFNYSLEQDKHSHTIYDLGLSMPVARHGKASVGFRQLEYKITGVEDSVWLFSYSHKLM